MEPLSKFLLPGIVFLLTLVSGFWLSSAGKPLNSLIFNIHKLIALGAVVFIVIQIHNAAKSAGVQGLLIGLFVLAATCVIALFATGARMSIGKSAYTTFLLIHQISPGVLLIAIAGIIYLLSGRTI